MKPRLIQTDGIPSNNKAEKAMLIFLKELSGKYTIYRELKLNREYDARVKGMEKAQPDFVVVSPEIGLLSIEVKDWNIIYNQYSWKDQYTVVRQTIKTGDETEIGNPVNQADNYRHAFMELIKDTRVWVTSIVAFPRLSRHAFLNKIANIEVLQNPQSKFYIDLDTVIFKEDIDEFYINPEKLLMQIVRKQPKFRTASDTQIHMVNERILPDSFRIGDLTKRQQEREHLNVITEQQEKWIFDLERKASYLLDVAGSGKTNVLVSRAIHIINQAHKQRENPPNILLTTYNPNLQRNIERILDGKIKSEERNSRYKTLRIENVENIMERVAISGYGINQNEYHKLNPPMNDSYQKTLRDDVKAALQDNLSKYAVFDYVLIDEIQDFDDDQLNLVRQLARTENFFFVGDIGQKIYDRYHDLKRHGFIIDELDLPKSYKMYRTPRYIGELAHRFIMSDTSIRSEFEQHGYRQDTEFESHNNNATELLRTQNPIQAIIERLEDLLMGRYTEDDIMVITSMQLLSSYSNAFIQAGIQFGIGEPKQSGNINLVDFMNVKGLERDIILISGIEDLYNRANGLFDDLATQLKEERFSRRKIYVALTRSIEECTVFYSDSGNIFISELNNINRKIMAKRQGAT